MSSISSLVQQIEQQGIQLWADEGKLKIQAKRGVMTPVIRAELAANKAEILNYLLRDTASECSAGVNSNGCCDTPIPGLSLKTIGRLIGGYSNGEAFVPPVIDASQMAQKLKVTFRPLPKGYSNKTIVDFREQLKTRLANSGVQILPWQDATTESKYDITLPGLGLKRTIKSTAVRSDISAMVDVERSPAFVGKAKVCIAENLYRLYSRFWLKDRKLSVSKIAQFISWAEDNLHDMEDPTNTQVIVLSDIDAEFIDPDLRYEKKIPIGVGTLVRTFSEIVIGVSAQQLSILNMNLSDSVFSAEAIDEFVTKSLIPKIFVPILPLSLSRFQIGHYAPIRSSYARELMEMGQAIAPTGLLPAGFKIDDVVKRKSHRDIIDWMAKGRTGVSYGFVCYAEPPQYVGEVTLPAEDWPTLSPVPGYSPDELRQNSVGRWFLRYGADGPDDGQFCCRQVPDIWLVSSRSGANKTDLNLESDVVRVGLQGGRLHLQLPEGVDSTTTDVKPSYDLYVMIGLALGSALFAPALTQGGMPMIHFHGYPSSQWFADEQDHCTGVSNPSVPCGTYESGIFNFLGVYRLAQQHGDNIMLAGLVEPDHGINLIAQNARYLLEKVCKGVSQDEITLGGKHFSSLAMQERVGSGAVEP